MELTMEYKKFFSIINHDTEIDIFIGKVINTDDSLSFYGKTISEMEEMFYQSIDNYLEACNKYNRKPSRKDI